MQTINNHYIPPIIINNQIVQRFQGLKDAYDYRGMHNNDADFTLHSSVQKTPNNFQNILPFLDQGYMIIECIRVYKVVRMRNINNLIQYYERRYDNPVQYHTTFDNRYITYIK